jgi:ZIP family zinc transporter
MATQIHDYGTRENYQWEGQAVLSQNGVERSDNSNREDEEPAQVGTTLEDDHSSDGLKEDDCDTGPAQKDQEENDKLMRMGINTAVAIGLHNFPEGLATFVATLHDARVGGVLAIAIALHNIPEGICVAMPIYYATGNRWKAFGWAAISGVSELLGALLGWAVLANFVSDDMFAVLFGLVAGMMVIISVRELLPTAHRYDPEDSVVTNSFMVGMAIMALSLVLMSH